MSRTSYKAAFALVCAHLTACAETSQERVQIPLEVTGTAPAGTVLSLGDVPVTLTRADLAFGPLYLCAGTQAGELCETARLEWLDSVVVDALDEAGHLELGAAPLLPIATALDATGTRAAWSLGRTILLDETDGGGLLRELPTPLSPVVELAFVGDGALLVLSADGRASLLGSARLPYWQLHDNGHETLLKKLGLGGS